MSCPSGKAKKGESNEGRFCSRACSAVSQRRYASRAAAKQAYHQRLAAQRAALRVPKPCVVCGSLIAGGGHRKACSAACRLEMTRSRYRLQMADPRPCRECRTNFTPAYGYRRRFFCSLECNKAWNKRTSNGVRRARLRGLPAETVDPLLVFERDGWRCYQCGRSTPKHLRGTTDPGAPELDHVVPIAGGGGHTYENTACCCRSCNNAKGAKVYARLEPFTRPDQVPF
ncbi:HNH endonuclease [Azospirillum thermophilum]|uniref:HNH nuclease domain-containing protein n=1 Tax=Azospirillum thermophilum TaxID=2202148 RepID=A0A2S2D0M6_9PROT|nr:hypothetical protein DEW08_30260 [Azospirillum thermophilum]